MDLTPAVGGELCGFAAREQPSTGCLDALGGRALWLEGGGRRLLWMHGDLIGFTTEFVTAFRAWCAAEFGLEASEVLLSATHTHSGPATIHLEGAGRYDPAYLDFLLASLQQAARLARQAPEPCVLVTAETRSDLAIHRTGPGTRHVDPRVAAVGFRRGDGSWLAVLANVAVHPVALGHENRAISGDIFGAAATELTRRLPGAPVVFLTNGACGNLNPPAVNVAWEQVQAWGSQLANTLAVAVRSAPVCAQQTFSSVQRQVALPLDVLTPEQLSNFVAKVRGTLPASAFGDKLGAVVLRWRDAQRASGAAPRGASRLVELHAVRLGDAVFLGVEAEIFSEFNDLVRSGSGRSRVYTVGYANGDVGYVCPRAAFADGGYEVDLAHVFYGGWRFAPGAHEQLADEAVRLLRPELTAAPPALSADARV